MLIFEYYSHEYKTRRIFEPLINPVIKVKRNGVYHARLVAKDFCQITRMDFTDNYSQWLMMFHSEL